MAERSWIATPEQVFTRWCVVERVEGRTVRVVADDLSEEEARRIAASSAMQSSLHELLNPALEEELPSEEARQRAMQSYLASKGYRVTEVKA